MEKLEIVLLDFKKRDVNDFIDEELKLSTLRTKSSHFYDNLSKKDLRFDEVEDLKEILSPKGTGHVFLESLDLGALIKEVVVVFSFDEVVGNIVFNFPQEELFAGQKEEIVLKLKAIINYLVRLKRKYGFSEAIIGYEPAEDEDTKLITIYDQMISEQKIMNMIP